VLLNILTRKEGFSDGRNLNSANSQTFRSARLGFIFVEVPWWRSVVGRSLCPSVDRRSCVWFPRFFDHIVRQSFAERQCPVRGDGGTEKYLRRQPWT
jgi:hypothetical protein